MSGENEIGAIYIPPEMRPAEADDTAPGVFVPSVPQSNNNPTEDIVFTLDDDPDESKAASGDGVYVPQTWQQSSDLNVEFKAEEPKPTEAPAPPKAENEKEHHTTKAKTTTKGKQPKKQTKKTTMKTKTMPTARTASPNRAPAANNRRERIHQAQETRRKIGDGIMKVAPFVEATFAILEAVDP